MNKLCWGLFTMEYCMFKKFTNGCVRVVNRWLPDPFLFAIILSIVVYVAAMLGTQQGPVAMIKAWGNTSGFWNLLAFSTTQTRRQPHLLEQVWCAQFRRLRQSAPCT